MHCQEPHWTCSKKTTSSNRYEKDQLKLIPGCVVGGSLLKGHNSPLGRYDWWRILLLLKRYNSSLGKHFLGRHNWWRILLLLQGHNSPQWLMEDIITITLADDSFTFSSYKCQPDGTQMSPPSHLTGAEDLNTRPEGTPETTVWCNHWTGYEHTADHFSWCLPCD